MQEKEINTQIVDRFFIAIDRLKTMKAIRGRQTFCNKYGINRQNLWQLDQDHSRGIFKTAWLVYLVQDYHLSALWLLTGEGDMFSI